MKQKQKKTPLGQSIIKSMAKKQVYVPHDDMAIFLQKTQTNEEFEKAQKLRSIIEQNSLSEFLVQAELSNKNFEADRNVKMKDIREQLVAKKIKPQELAKQQEIYQVERNKVLTRLRIPRRPLWNQTDSKNEILKKQNEAFLDWRRKLAEVEEREISIRMTPFEKNIEVWKQLWRVVERAHILVQIVDARDPLFYRCEDLEAYVTEVSKDKKNLLVVNKSDLVSEEIRKIWSQYFNQRGITHIFFSAKIEQVSIEKQLIAQGVLIPEDKNSVLEEIKREERESELRETKKQPKKVVEEEDEEQEFQVKRNNPFDNIDSDQEEEEQQTEQEKPVAQSVQQNVTEQPKVEQVPEPAQTTVEPNQATQTKQQDKKQQAQVTETQVKDNHEEAPVETGSKINTYHICNSEQLVKCIQELGASFRQKHGSKSEKFQLEIGMVGYPNVGKSSVINSLLHKKKVAVASLPGKTKHYQTLYLNHDTLLCDCPGLVFPNVASTLAQMVLNGVIPIDTLREFYTPVQLLVARVPRQVVERKYHLKLKDDIYTAESLLQSYATLKGFFTGRGLPNESYASRFILKDYTNGQLIYCKLPPDCKETGIWQSNRFEGLELLLTVNEEKEHANTKEKQLALQEEVVDEKFFEAQAALDSDEQMKALIMEDVLDLMEGKTIQGIKLKKQIRKEIKFGLKRGEDLETIKKKYLLSKRIVSSTHKAYVKV